MLPKPESLNFLLIEKNAIQFRIPAKSMYIIDSNQYVIEQIAYVLVLLAYFFVTNNIYAFGRNSID